MDVIKMLSIAAVFVLYLLRTEASSTDSIEELDAVIQTLFEESQMPGMAVAIVKGDELLYEKGFGFADVETQRKVDEGTLFFIHQVIHCPGGGDAGP